MKVDAVVHTLGILLEDSDYKQALRDGNVSELFLSFFRIMTGDTSNPLKRGTVPESCGKEGKRMTYEAMNKVSGENLRGNVGVI